jgi:hypothetical protein
MAQIYMNDGTVTGIVYTETWDSFTSIGIDYRQNGHMLFTVSMTVSEAADLCAALAAKVAESRNELDSERKQKRRESASTTNGLDIVGDSHVEPYMHVI